MSIRSNEYNGKNWVFALSPARKHNSSKQSFISCSLKSKDYESVETPKIFKLIQELSQLYQSEKPMIGHTANSDPQVQGQVLRNMHSISNSRKSWSRSPMKNRDRMPKSIKCR